MSDQDLLLAYARGGSHDAFATLVRRHVHLVHSAAMRQTGGDASLADDITQAVFVVLTRRAGSLPGRATLPGWLIRTTRYASLAALKSQSRRRRHEQKAAVMMPESAPAADEPVDLASLIDDAISRLPAPYRAAVTLRYLQNKSIEEVSATLGISEANARKRISRALEKLRARFARRGVSTPADAVAAFLTEQSTHVAPTALVATLVAPTFHAAPAAAAIAKAVAVAQAKFLLTTSAVLIAVVALVAIPTLHYFSEARVIPVPRIAAAASPAFGVSAPVRPPAATAPSELLVRFASADFTPMISPAYQSGLTVDPRRGVVPVAVIRSVTPNANLGTRLLTASAAPFRGKRVRLATFAKTVDVTDWAGLRLTVYAADNRILADDDMGGRPIHGTTDWQLYHVVVDVPDNAAYLLVGATLRGPGEFWTDDFLLEAVGSDTPPTDDTNWHLWSPKASHYAAALDPANTLDGHPTLCVSSVTAPPGAWVNYDRYDRSPDKFLGHRIRMTARVKSDHLTSTAGLLIRVLGPAGSELVGDGQRGKRPVRGTSDWTTIEAVADVPKNAQAICTGITMNGRGKLWFDDVRYEVVDSPATTPSQP